jgi:hypothetical protein
LEDILLTLGIWDALEVIHSPESDYTKSLHAGLVATGCPLATSLPLSETVPTLATRVRRMVLGWIAALATFAFFMSEEADSETNANPTKGSLAL